MGAFMRRFRQFRAKQNFLFTTNPWFDIPFYVMKRLNFLIPLFLVAFSQLQAQGTYDTIASPFNTIVHAFGELDPQYMPNGILFHAVVPLEQPLRFGGHYDRHDQTTLTPGRFGALAMTVQSAVIDLDQPNLFDTSYVKYYRKYPLMKSFIILACT